MKMRLIEDPDQEDDVLDFDASMDFGRDGAEKAFYSSELENCFEPCG